MGCHTHQQSGRIRIWSVIGCLAVFWVVAAVLVPFFARTGGNPPRGSICLNNLKQIATAVNMYTADYEEMYPTNRATRAGPLVPQALTTGPTTSNPQVNYVDALEKYVQKTSGGEDTSSVWKCPGVSGYGLTGRKALPGWGDNRITYGMNFALFGEREGTTKNPSSTLLFRELGVMIQANAVAITTTATAKPTKIFLDDPDDWFRSAPGYSASGHGSKTHVLFVDGHVDRFPVNTLTTANVVNTNVARPDAWCLQDASGRAVVWLTP